MRRAKGKEKEEGGGERLGERRVIRGMRRIREG